VVEVLGLVGAVVAARGVVEVLGYHQTNPCFSPP
jgi:hypothetical protein